MMEQSKLAPELARIVLLYYFLAYYKLHLPQ